MKSEFRLLFILCVWLAGFRLSAQEGGMSMKVCFLSWQEGMSTPLYARTGAEDYQPLSLRSNRRSRRTEVPRADVLRLYTDGEDAEGRPVKVPAVDIPIPEGVEEPLVILFQRDSTPRRIGGMVVEDSASVFPFGSYRVMNLSAEQMVFELNGEARDLSPREGALFTPDEQERINLPMRLLASIDGKPRLVRQTFWRHEPDQRMWVFILRSDNPQRSDLVLRTVAEREDVYHRMRVPSLEAEP